jgi:hypothetical protein
MVTVSESVQISSLFCARRQLRDRNSLLGKMLTNSNPAVTFEATTSTDEMGVRLDCRTRVVESDRHAEVKELPLTIVATDAMVRTACPRMPGSGSPTWGGYSNP